MKDTLERIEQRLAVLSPDSVELIDDSEKHAGHAGAKGGGGHFQLIIVSPLFGGKSTQARHRMVHEPGINGARQRVVLELDCHGRGDPQVIGAILAATALPSSARELGLRAIDAAVRLPRLPEGVDVRRLREGVPGLQPYAPGEAPRGNGTDPWRGVPAERRWAMEVLGLAADMDLERNDVQARFRRLIRLAHPDHGAARDGAAERLAELTDARELLLTVIGSSD